MKGKLKLSRKRYKLQQEDALFRIEDGTLYFNVALSNYSEYTSKSITLCTENIRVKSKIGSLRNLHSFNFTTNDATIIMPNTGETQDILNSTIKLEYKKKNLFTLIWEGEIDSKNPFKYQGLWELDFIRIDKCNSNEEAEEIFTKYFNLEEFTYERIDANKKIDIDKIEDPIIQELMKTSIQTGKKKDDYFNFFPIY